MLGVTGERPERPDPEVPECGRQRTFTAHYKPEVLAAYDVARPGEKSAILRREGLYSTHIVDWRRSRDASHQPRLPRPGPHRTEHRESGPGAGIAVRSG